MNNIRKIKRIWIQLLGLFALNCSGQSETIFNASNTVVQQKAREFNQEGWSIWWLCDSLQPGDLFTNLKLYSGLGSDDEMVLINTWEDSMTLLTHRQYYQKYKSILIDGTEFREHINNGSVVLSSGVIVENLDLNVNPDIGENIALDSALKHVNATHYAWLDDSLQYYLIYDSANLTTYYPEGELVLTLKGDTMPQLAQNYVLAWKFQILALDSQSSYNKVIYINANSGAFIKEHNMNFDGSINHIYYGSVTPDTKWHSGVPSGKFWLWADDNGKFIKTKDVNYNGNWEYFSLPSKSNDVWGNQNWAATSSHYVISYAWDFFRQAPYFRHGVDDHNKQIRIWADNPVEPGSSYEYFHKRNYDIIHIGRFEDNNNFGATIDVGAHEYTHGITVHTAQLNLPGQQGALNESYSDIFGFMAERAFRPSSWNWTIGEDASTNLVRDLASPGTQVEPRTTKPQCGDLPPYYPQGFFQTNYYLGQCDNQGVHHNSTVQSYCFYLLSMGGSQNGHTVTGVGIDKAAAIAYYALNHIVDKNTFYTQNREHWVEAAIILFGKCSFEHLQTCKAWAAVNIGQPCSCEPIDIDCGNSWNRLSETIPTLSTSQKDSFLSELSIFPNPTSRSVYLNINGLPNSVNHLKVELINSFGQLVKILDLELNNIKRDFIEISMDNYSSGVYSVRVSAKDVQKIIRVIKIENP